MVVLEGMGALVAAVAVEAVGVEHQFEVLAGFLEGVNQEQSVLIVDIVVTGAVGEAEHCRVVLEI